MSRMMGMRKTRWLCLGTDELCGMLMNGPLDELMILKFSTWLTRSHRNQALLSKTLYSHLSLSFAKAQDLDEKWVGNSQSRVKTQSLQSWSQRGLITHYIYI